MDPADSPRVKEFALLAARTHSLYIQGLSTAAKAALLSTLQQTSQASLLIINGKEDPDLFSDLTAFGLHPLDFPAWETLPGEEIPPSADIVGKRLETLLSMRAKGKILLASVPSCLQKIPTPQNLHQHSQRLRVGATLSLQGFEERLLSMGYKRVPLVSDKIEFALRGGIIDLFPPSSTDPYRIELLGDTVEQIRCFDPVSQKSLSKVEEILICPASELLDTEHLATLFDYMGDDLIILCNDPLAIEDKLSSLQSMPGAKSPLFLDPALFLKQVLQYRHIFFSPHALAEFNGELFHQKIDPTLWQHPFAHLCDFFCVHTPAEMLQAVSRHEGKVRFFCSTEGDHLSLQERFKLEQFPLPSHATFEVGSLSSGFVLQDTQECWLPMKEWTGRHSPRRQKWRSSHHSPAAEFHELSPGDLVIHFHSGVAKYLGTETLPNHTGQETEFIVLEFAEKGKLYVPMSQSHLVSRYIGTAEARPLLNTLGSSRWQNTRAKAQKAILGYASDLLKMQAERVLHGSAPYQEDSQEMRLFEEDFPFEETEDQIQAIHAIKHDLLSGQAMDRLVCGDVGYGKTEVAMRAAFKTVVDGQKQVAVLVPTTILALQHYETFCARMGNSAVRIGILSRFSSAKQIKETLDAAAKGTIDILIGTHRLIGQDVHFAALGLIIIDEEQRFGVRAKEHLKALKINAHCLTLSATPIPRTLYLSLIGAREISVINTPPQDRLPIKSILSERSPAVIQNALLREFAREGQAFFIHNRVESIFSVASELQKLVPTAKIAVVHGQMSAEEIDTIFHSFKTGASNLLVATTLIENGIDIPQANTIFIDRADTFGLADLYQMRGRVGRWDRPAYAYFLVPAERELPELARKRLNALLTASGYGAGMKIAMRDLEIRGTGDILGTQQSGQVSAIGFHLYCKLLKKAVDALKKQAAPSFTETKMEFSYPAHLPTTYINEASLRMEIYHRLGEASSHQEAEEILAECQDRFGTPPLPVLWLYHLTRIKTYASSHNFTLLKFEKLTFTAERVHGMTTIRKTILLPKAAHPSALEAHVIASLKTTFEIL